MNFWERVNVLLEQKDINKKTLAAEAGFCQSNITKGIRDNNMPSAETAVKIAKILGVTVEYLVTGEDRTRKDYLSVCDNSRKYQTFLSKVDSLSQENKELVFDLVEKLGEK